MLDLVKRVRDNGLPVVLISHNMPHVFAIADRIHVARLGRRAAVLNPKKISMNDAVAVMTGARRPKTSRRSGRSRETLWEPEDEMTRTILAAAIAAALTVAALAQSGAKALPLDNLGLEHLDIIVPDPAASARFYSRIFKAPLHQQPVRDTLRYFVVLGDVPADRQVGYVAIGAAGQRQPAIGHYCVLAKVYDRAGMASTLQTAGFGVAAAGPTGMWPDPDNLELQLFQLPAGLVTAAVPSPLEVQRDGLLTPRGVDHVMLRVTSLDKSLPYYRLVYGNAVERPRDRNGRVWLDLAGNTRLGLEEAAQRPDADDRALRDQGCAVRSRAHSRSVCRS